MKSPETPLTLSRRPASAGFSLVELMVALAVVGVLMGAVFTLFTGFLRSSGEQAALAKRSFDARMGLSLVRRDLRSAGFGIEQDNLAGAVAGTASSVTIRSTAVHSRADTGVHGVIQDDGSVNDGKGGTVGTGEFGAALSPDRELLDTGDLSNVGADAGNLFFVGCGVDSTDCPNYFYERQYALGGDSPECAPNTPDLQYTDQDSGSPVSVLDCVQDFRVRYGFEDSSGAVQFTNDPGASIGDGIPDLVKAGLVIQAGDDYPTTRSPASLSYNDPVFGGATVSLSDSQRRYRWLVEEFSVSLENLQ